MKAWVASRPALEVVAYTEAECLRGAEWLHLRVRFLLGTVFSGRQRLLPGPRAAVHALWGR